MLQSYKLVIYRQYNWYREKWWKQEIIITKSDIHVSFRQRIEKLRLVDMGNEMSKKARYDKTSKSKDVIIAAKDRRIAKLEEENRKLRSENEHLRGRLYDIK